MEASKVISILTDQVGYIEKASNKDLDSKTGNRGTANYTKFSRDVNDVGLMGCQAQPWCGTYQFWGDLKAFGKDAALKLWGMTPRTYCGYSCFATYDVFKAAGKVGMTPKLGSLVIFTFSHMGRVTRVYQNGSWDCIEGNTSSDLNDRNGGMVKVKHRTTDSTVKGFCYVDYDEQPVGWHWVYAGGKWYYQDGDGNNTHGWKLIKESAGEHLHWFYFNEKGAMQTGLLSDEGDLYYLMEEGALEGACCRTDQSGALKVWNVDEP